MENLPFVLTDLARLDQQLQIIQGKSDRSRLGHHENSRHRLPSADSFVGVLGYGLYVVSHQEPTFHCTPIEDSRVFDSGESYILNTYDVEVRDPAKQTSKEVTVEILICGEPEHPQTGSPR